MIATKKIRTATGTPLCRLSAPTAIAITRRTIAVGAATFFAIVTGSLALMASEI